MAPVEYAEESLLARVVRWSYSTALGVDRYNSASTGAYIYPRIIVDREVGLALLVGSPTRSGLLQAAVMNALTGETISVGILNWSNDEFYACWVNGQLWAAVYEKGRIQIGKLDPRTFTISDTIYDLKSPIGVRPVILTYEPVTKYLIFTYFPEPLGALSEVLMFNLNEVPPSNIAPPILLESSLRL